MTAPQIAGSRTCMVSVIDDPAAADIIRLDIHLEADLEMLYLLKVGRSF